MSCNICNDTGFYLKTTNKEDMSAICTKCDSHHQKNLIYLYRQINLPETYTKYSLEDYPLKEQNKENMEKITKYVNNFNSYRKDGMGLYIYSNTPSYKDSLVVMIVKEIINKYKVSNIYYNTMANVISEVFNGWNFAKDKDIFVITNCFDMAKIPLTTNSRQLAIPAVYQFFNNILDSNKTLIMTSTYSLDEIGNYGYIDFKDLLQLKLFPLKIEGTKQQKPREL